MDSNIAEMYDIEGLYMEQASNAITGFSANECKVQAKLAGADALMIQSKETLQKMYFIAITDMDNKFLEWKKVAPGEFLERIGQV